MIIAVEDKSYRCKDCDSFNQCAYYHCRRPTSHICKEFTNDSKVAEILDKISEEIKRMEYHMIDCDVLVSQEEVLDILDNIDKAENEEGGTS